MQQKKSQKMETNNVTKKFKKKAPDVKPAKIFLQYEELRKEFPIINSGELLGFMGYEFFWLKAATEPLVILARKDEKNFSLVCTVEAPEDFCGVGIFSTDYPKLDDGRKALILTFFRHSYRIADLSRLLYEKVECDNVGVMYFEGQDLDKLYSLAEERFEDIR